VYAYGKDWVDGSSPSEGSGGPAKRRSERELHLLEHLARLREADLVVLHDLDAVAPRVEEASWQDLDTCGLQPTAGPLLVVDDEPK
jgi:hypothetical protein